MLGEAISWIETEPETSKLQPLMFGPWIQEPKPCRLEHERGGAEMTILFHHFGGMQKTFMWFFAPFENMLIFQTTNRKCVQV